jgi:hypothetical protein
MGLITLIGTIGLISALMQIFFTESFLKLKPFGARTKESVKIGGYITLVACTLFIITDIFFIN